MAVAKPGYSGKLLSEALISMTYGKRRADSSGENKIVPGLSTHPRRILPLSDRQRGEKYPLL